MSSYYLGKFTTEAVFTAVFQSMSTGMGEQYILAFRPSILAIAGKATPSGGNTMKRKASTSLVSVYLNGLCMAIWIVFAIVAFDSTYDLLFSSLRVITAILWAVAFFQSVLRFRKQAKNDASSS